MIDYLVKVNQKKRYVRITIPNVIVEKVGLRKYPFVKIRAMKNGKIEVQGVTITEEKKR